jgi:hypothetical protein
MKTKRLLFTALALLGLTATTMAQNVPPYVPTNGLVGWWPFSGNANDESGNGNNGTVIGAALTTDRFGNSNKSYLFDGISNRIAFNLNSINNLFPSSTESTASIWIKTTDLNGPLISMQGNNGIEFDFHIGTLADILQNPGHYGILVRDNCCGTGNNGFASNCVDNSWHMLSIVRLSDGTLKFYKDAVLELTSGSGQNGALVFNPNFMTFGAHNGWIVASQNGGCMSCNSVDQQHYNGSLDDIGIWNRALTQQEITALYQNCSNPIAAINAQGNTTFCQGGFVTLSANTATGNTYQWYVNNNAIGGATAANYTATQSGNYTVLVSNNGCSAASSAVNVTVNAIPNSNVTISGPATFCSGSSVTLTAQGTGTYLWSNGATTNSITVNQSGNYSVTVTSNGCSATSSPINITVNQSPTAVITPQGNTTFCQGGFVTLTAGGGGSYQWNTGSTSSSINVSQTGNYSVVVTANGCTSQASQSVTVNPLPTMSLAAINPFTNINGSNIALSGNPSGGVFSGNGVSGNSFNPQNAGLGSHLISYSYSNSNGCSNTAASSTIVYDTLGNVCTSYDTVLISVTDTLWINTTVSGINPPNNVNTIKIFPNPTSDHITINYGNFSILNGYQLKIENSIGQQVFQTTISQQSDYLNLSTWGGNGLYYVRLIDQQGNIIDIRKIVLQ